MKKIPVEFDRVIRAFRAANLMSGSDWLVINDTIAGIPLALRTAFACISMEGKKINNQK